MKESKNLLSRVVDALARVLNLDESQTDKAKKVSVVVILTLIGLALAVFVFSPAGLPYAAEIAKFAPGIIAGLVAFAKSHDAQEEAKKVKTEARLRERRKQ